MTKDDKYIMAFCGTETRKMLKKVMQTDLPAGRKVIRSKK